METRPNIYDQEHTIMNNASYERTAQRITSFVTADRIFCAVQLLISQFVLLPLACAPPVGFCLFVCFFYRYLENIKKKHEFISCFKYVLQT